MSRSLVTSALIAALALVAVAVTAEAAPVYVYGNYGSVATQTTSNTVGYLNVVQNNVVQAQGFNVGATPWQLASVDVGLANSGTSVPVPLVEIYSSGTASTPDTLLATLTGPTGGGSISGKQTYSFSGSLTLAANTGYWLVLKDSAALTQQSSYEWFAEDAFTTPSEKNGSGIGWLGTLVQNFSGGPWNSALPSLSIRVNAVAVPEPPTYALAMVAGVLGAGAAARRRASKA